MGKSKGTEQVIKVYGIRHHGPGSAGNLLSVLQKQQPDCLLIEGPADANNLLTDLNIAEFKPPVAILVYDPKDLENAVFVPFAGFSPEWVAIKFAINNQLHLRFIDLPMGAKMEPTDQVDIANLILPDIVRDPLGTLAKAQGYRDVESWWESHFELLESDRVFSEISTLIQLMRASNQEKTPREVENNLREAYMREQIRLALKEGYSNIAVVCGAWHTPALEHLQAYPANQDKKTLSTIGKKRTHALWTPWSYSRLAKESGYGAGVKAPMWYDILYRFPDNPGMHWMAYTAHELRKAGYETPPSLSIDATLLSSNLAALRGLTKPGYQELTDASVAVFGYTDEGMINRIYEDIPVGNIIGSIPDTAERLPIQEDFEKQCRQLRLSKDLKHTYSTPRQLDFRKELHRSISAFLHQLIIIGIPWGKKQQASGQGTFREDWILQWDPQFYFNLLDAGTYGLTVYDAAVQKSKGSLDTASLPELIQLLELCLDANLTAVVSPVLLRIKDITHESQDTFILLKSFNAISKLIISGHSKSYDFTFLQVLRGDLLLYIILRLVEEANQLDAEKAGDLYKEIILADQYLNKKPIAGLNERWHEQLLQLALTVKSIHAIHGACFRLLSDRQVICPEKQISTLSAVFSMHQTIEESAYWLEGFFQNSFLVLLYSENLWLLVNQWIQGLSQESFIAVLPLLRRAFSECDSSLKSKIFKKAGGQEEVPLLDKEELPASITSQLDKILGG